MAQMIWTMFLIVFGGLLAISTERPLIKAGRGLTSVKVLFSLRLPYLLTKSARRSNKDERTVGESSNSVRNSITLLAACLSSIVKESC